MERCPELRDFELYTSHSPSRLRSRCGVPSILTRCEYRELHQAYPAGREMARPGAMGSDRSLTGSSLLRRSCGLGRAHRAAAQASRIRPAAAATSEPPIARQCIAAVAERVTSQCSVKPPPSTDSTPCTKRRRLRIGAVEDDDRCVVDPPGCADPFDARVGGPGDRGGCARRCRKSDATAVRRYRIATRHGRPPEHQCTRLEPQRHMSTSRRFRWVEQDFLRNETQDSPGFDGCLYSQRERNLGRGEGEWVTESTLRT